VFKEFTVLRRVLSDSSMDVCRNGSTTTTDYAEPIIPRSRLSQALARLRLHFSDAELSAEVMLSSSKAGLNHDEFMYLVSSNISRRMSIEKVIKAFLQLQPSGTMGVDELKTFMMSSSLHREGDLNGEADAEPLTEEEFSMFCGLADPRGTQSVYIFSLLACFYPKASHGMLETLLAKHGIGASIELRDEAIRQESNHRAPIEESEGRERSQVMLAFAALVAQMEQEREAKAKAAEAERQQRAREEELEQQKRARQQELEQQKQAREQEQRDAAAAHAQRTVAQNISDAQQREAASRRAVDDAERSERAALEQSAAKSKKANTPLPPKPKADVGCCRIVPDKK
jgi:hypothetical protein